MNRVIEEVARSYVDFNQYRLWEIVAEIEFAINDSVNPETGLSPFESTLGQSPLRPIELSTGACRESQVGSIAEHFDRIVALQSQVRDGLIEAQSKWVYEANKHRRAVALTEFQPGDFVFVDRRNFVPEADRTAPAAKLQQRFYGPYKIAQRASATRTA